MMTITCLIGVAVAASFTSAKAVGIEAPTSAAPAANACNFRRIAKVLKSAALMGSSCLARPGQISRDNGWDEWRLAFLRPRKARRDFLLGLIFDFCLTLHERSGSTAFASHLLLCQEQRAQSWHCFTRW